MPIYEYICVRCGNRLEAFQKVNEPPLQKCRICGGQLKKLVSPPAIQFRGNGWYITDYARKSPPEKNQETKPAAGQESALEKKSTEAAKPSSNQE